MRKAAPVEARLRLHRLLPRSYSNGPGARAVIWVQGCTLGCPGCFNPETHAPGGGETIAVEALFRQILVVKDQIEGITISGGEPLQQWQPLNLLLRKIRQETDLSTIVFTGFTMEELHRIKGIEMLLSNIDVLIAGRFQMEHRLAQGLRGSENKRCHFLTGRYQPVDLERIPAAEVVIQPDGSVDLSGIDPIRWDQ